MNCEQFRREINEMPASEFRNLGREAQLHMDSCAACSQVHKLRVLAVEALVDSRERTKAGVDFERKLLGALDREMVSHREPGRWSLGWGALFRPRAALALSVMLLLFSGYNYMRTLGYFTPAGEVPASMERFVADVGHDAYLYSRQSQTLELTTQNPEEVRRWFATRMPVPVEVPARLRGGYAMQGTRLWHTVSRLSALVSYGDESGQSVALFVISGENLADHGGRTVRRGDHTYHTGTSYRFNVVAWKNEGAGYALVSRIPRDELLQIAESYADQ